MKELEVLLKNGKGQLKYERASGWYILQVSRDFKILFRPNRTVFEKDGKSIPLSLSMIEEVERRYAREEKEREKARREEAREWLQIELTEKG